MIDWDDDDQDDKGARPKRERWQNPFEVPVQMDESTSQRNALARAKKQADGDVELAHRKLNASVERFGTERARRERSPALERFKLARAISGLYVPAALFVVFLAVRAGGWIELVRHVKFLGLAVAPYLVLLSSALASVLFTADLALETLEAAEQTGVGAASNAAKLEAIERRLACLRLARRAVALPFWIAVVGLATSLLGWQMAFLHLGGAKGAMLVCALGGSLIWIGLRVLGAGRGPRS